MLLTITYTGKDTRNIGYLFHKNPARPQVFELNHGKAYVFYPEVSDAKTTIALLLDIDPIDLAKGKVGSTDGGLFDYVNDRPYVSSSFMSVAISRVFGTAMSGRGDSFQALADAKLDLSATLAMLPCRSQTFMLDKVFEPLGYEVAYETLALDESFPEWGGSRYVNLTLHARIRLSELLRHIYVLIPVFDKNKHYWIGKEEVDKLLSHGETWLKNHPEREFITRRYLSRSRWLSNWALERLKEADDEAPADGETASELPEAEIPEERLNLNRQRLGSVVAAVKACAAQSVIDLGCGEGNLLALLMKEPGLKKIAAMDVAFSVLEHAKERIKFEWLSEAQKQKLSIFQGALTYRDRRLEGFDVACVIEVIEHLNLSRLNAFERVLFEYARPKHVILTTPNAEYNGKYQLKGFRHSDHRFEWTRTEFKDWAERVAGQYAYSARFSEIGEQDENLGAPTQMVVFSANETTGAPRS